MNKNERLEFLRTRAKARVPLSEKAASILEELKTEDADLGGQAPGEILPPDDVRQENAPLATDDESEVNTSLISPLMREAVDA